MYSIESVGKEVVLTLTDDNITQKISIPFQGASFYVKEFLQEYYELYGRHKHAYKIKEYVGKSGLTPPVDWRGFSNLVYEGLLRKAYNAIQFGKADEATITNTMDVANKMFTEIHEFYRGYDSHWLTI